MIRAQKTHLGAKIAYLLKVQKKTAKQLADHIGRTVFLVYAIIKTGNTIHADKIADFFGVSAEYLENDNIDLLGNVLEIEEEEAQGDIVPEIQVAQKPSYKDLYEKAEKEKEKAQKLVEELMAQNTKLTEALLK